VGLVAQTQFGLTERDWGMRFAARTERQLVVREVVAGVFIVCSDNAAFQLNS
jgi:hypothetical protein